MIFGGVISGSPDSAPERRWDGAARHPYHAKLIPFGNRRSGEQLIEKVPRVFQPWVMRFCLALAAFAGILSSAGCEKNAATAAPPAPATNTNAPVNPTQYHLNRAQP